MNERNMAQTPEFELSDDSPMKALIIYDEPGSAVKADLVLQRSARNADFGVPWNINSWQIDLLKCSPTAEAALTDAVDAHLILVASCGAKSSTFWFRQWLEHWAKCHKIEGAALALLWIAPSDSLAGSSIHYFSRIAKNHGLSLIFDDGRGGTDQVRLIELALGWREQIWSESAMPVLDLQDRLPRICWGINE